MMRFPELWRVRDRSDAIMLTAAHPLSLHASHGTLMRLRKPKPRPSPSGRGAGGEGEEEPLTPNPSPGGRGEQQDICFLSLNKSECEENYERSACLAVPAVGWVLSARVRPDRADRACRLPGPGKHHGHRQSRGHGKTPQGRHNYLR